MQHSQWASSEYVGIVWIDDPLAPQSIIEMQRSLALGSVNERPASADWSR
jgi:hypothetical protein